MCSTVSWCAADALCRGLRRTLTGKPFVPGRGVTLLLLLGLTLRAPSSASAPGTKGRKGEWPVSTARTLQSELHPSFRVIVSGCGGEVPAVSV